MSNPANVLPTLTEYLSKNLPDQPELASLLNAIAAQGIEIASALRQAPFKDLLGMQGDVNVQGEDQKKLDVYTNELFLQMMHDLPQVAGMASEELTEIQPNPNAVADADLLVVFDPLDGSSNLESNVSVGSIFSILPNTDQPLSEQSFMQPGRSQLAAGYIMYGPATLLYLTVGEGTQLFTLDARDDQFYLTQSMLSIPYRAEYAINQSNRQYWTPAIKRYIEDCESGASGPLAQSYNMRWVAAMVAEAARIFSRGGVFLYPQDNKDPSKKGRIRLLYEAAPIAMLIEQAGGQCTDGREAIMDIVPADLHERIGVIFGSRQEVDNIANYYAEYER